MISSLSLPVLFNFSEPIGSGWQLVRHVPPGETWHRATDNLVGTDVYGAYVSDLTAASAFSVAFADTSFNEFLFATGDMSVWLRAPSSSVYGTYTNRPREVTWSSGNDGVHELKWSNRGICRSQDPFISVIDDKVRLSTNPNPLYDGFLLYSENSFDCNTELLNNYDGANVFIRWNSPSSSPTAAPTAEPTYRPTYQPTGQPTTQPSGQPTVKPSPQPTPIPSSTPSASPTWTPSLNPSSSPTWKSSSAPSASPTSTPSLTPSGFPTGTHMTHLCLLYQSTCLSVCQSLCMVAYESRPLSVFQLVSVFLSRHNTY